MTLRIKGWEKFQHYKNRKPPWIRLYADLLDDPEFEDLDGELVKTLVKLWMAASQFSTDGTLPDIKRLALRMHVASKVLAKHISKLNHWLIDDCYQGASKVLASETETETETETESERNAHARADNFDFNLFWRAYPLKKGKQAAKRAWTKAKKNGLPSTEELVRIVKIQSEWPQWKQGYIPFPATWLNAGRWEDEQGPTVAGPKSHAQAMRDRSVDALRQNMEDEQNGLFDRE